MKTNRESSLRNLIVGDIFSGACPDGRILICLVTSITEKTIQARSVPTQKNYCFDRQTGIEEGVEMSVACTIQSVEPLPLDVHNVILGLDRKFRLVRDIERLKLSETEKKALIFIDSYYSSYPL
jgi:hypothetical protein